MREIICHTCNYTFQMPDTFTGRPVCPDCLYLELIEPAPRGCRHGYCRGFIIGLLIGLALCLALVNLW